MLVFFLPKGVNPTQDRWLRSGCLVEEVDDMPSLDLMFASSEVGAG